MKCMSWNNKGEIAVPLFALRIQKSAAMLFYKAVNKIGIKKSGCDHSVIISALETVEWPALRPGRFISGESRS